MSARSQESARIGRYAISKLGGEQVRAYIPPPLPPDPPIRLTELQSLLEQPNHALGVVGAIGLLRLNTDPPLFFYFKKGSDIRQGVEAVDRSGGSSPLKLEVEDIHGAPLDTNEAYKRLWALNDALEKDPAVERLCRCRLLRAKSTGAGTRNC